MGMSDRFRGLVGAAERAAAEHPDQVKAALAKLEAAADQRTGGVHHDQIVKAGEKAQEFLDRQPKPGPTA